MTKMNKIINVQTCSSSYLRFAAPFPVAVAPAPLVLVLFRGREDPADTDFFSVGDDDTFDSLDDLLTIRVPVPSPSVSVVAALAVLATEADLLDFSVRLGVDALDLPFRVRERACCEGSGGTRSSSSSSSE